MSQSPSKRICEKDFTSSVCAHTWQEQHPGVLTFVELINKESPSAKKIAWELIWGK